MNLFKKDPLQIITFKSYGTANHLYVKGRALEDEGIDPTKKGFFSLLYNTYKRFETDLVKNTPLHLMLPDGRKIETKTDQQGYFLVDTAMDNLRPMVNEKNCLQYEIMFADSFPKRKIQNENRFQGEVFIPSEAAQFGVISDIDDTVVYTGVANTLKMMWRLFAQGADARPPLAPKMESGEKHFF